MTLPSAIPELAISEALDPNQTAAARQHESMVARSEHDEAELRELERTEYYGERPAVTTSEPTPAAARARFFDWLFRRAKR